MSNQPLRYASLSRTIPASTPRSPIFTPLPRIDAATRPAIDPIAEAFESGRKDAQAEYADIVARLETVMRALERERADLERRYRTEAASFIAHVLSAVAPKLSLAAALDALFARMKAEPPSDRPGSLRIRAHPSFCEDIRQAISATAVDPLPEFEGDEDAPYGSLTASWPGGGMELKTAEAIAAIAAEIDRGFGTSSVGNDHE